MKIILIFQFLNQKPKKNEAFKKHHLPFLIRISYFL